MSSKRDNQYNLYGGMVNANTANEIDSLFDDDFKTRGASINCDPVNQKTSQSKEDPGIDISQVRTRITNLEKKISMIDKKIDSSNKLLRQMISTTEASDNIGSEAIDNCMLELSCLKNEKKKISSKKKQMENMIDYVIRKVQYQIQKEIDDKKQKENEELAKIKKMEDDIRKKIYKEIEDKRLENEKKEKEKNDMMIQKNKKCTDEEMRLLESDMRMKLYNQRKSYNLVRDFTDSSDYAETIERKIMSKIKEEELKKKREEDAKVNYNKKKEVEAKQNKKAESETERREHVKRCEKLDMDKMCVFM